jgi:hypothetical protein
MPAPAPVPPTIAGYTFLSLIAQGRASAVWTAADEAEQRTVAIKVVPITEAVDAARFLREARALRSLEHPNVVRCHAAGRQEHILYLVMEYLTGGDVARLIQRSLVAEATALRIARDVAAGLEALDRAGLTHRDIAPGNILLDQAGTAKIGDFGLVRSTAASRLTRTGEVLGTPAYAAPEQVRGARNADVRSDIYAVGAMLYALITGSPPFTGSTLWAVMEQVEHAPRPDPRTLAPTVSTQARAIIQCAMALSPDDRYQSPSELHEDLIAVTGGGVPRNAGRRRPRAQLEEHVAAPPWWSAASLPAVGLGMLGAALLGMLLGYGSTAGESADHRAARQARDQKSAESWTAYLARFPQGQALAEATTSIQLHARLDELAGELRSGEQLLRQRTELAAQRFQAGGERAPAPPIESGAALHAAPASATTSAAPPAPTPPPRPPQSPSAPPPGTGAPAAAPSPDPAAPRASPAPAAPAQPAPAQAFPALPVPAPVVSAQPNPAAASSQRPLQRETMDGTPDFVATWCHPADARIILLWNIAGDVWRSSNGAASWVKSEVAGGLLYPAVQAYADAAGNAIFIPSRGPMLGIISTDGGVHFRAVPPPWPVPTPAPVELAASPQFQAVMNPSGQLIVGWKESVRSPGPWKLQTSRDQGASWTLKEVSTLVYFALYPGRSATLLFTYDGPSRSTSVSSDLGSTWKPIVPANRDGMIINALPFAAEAERLTLLDSTHGPRLIMLDRDGMLVGVQPLDPRQRFHPPALRVWLRALAIDPSDPRILYLAGTGIGLARSMDHGASWACCAVDFAAQFGAGIELSFTAGPAQRLVMTTRKEVTILDDHAHLAEMFPVPLDTVLTNLASQKPR